MRAIGFIIFAFVFGLAVASIIRNTNYWKERHRRVAEWYCKKSGASEAKIENGWTVYCVYNVDKKGNIILP